MRIRFCVSLLSLFLPLGAIAQSLTGVSLGAAPSTLEALSMRSVAREGHAQRKATKFILENGNNLSVTYDSKSDKILYIEDDWSLKDEGKLSGMDSLIFGFTTLDDLRQRNGSNGFSWKSIAMHRDGDDVVAFNAYEIRDKPGAIAVFVTVAHLSEYEIAPPERRKISSFLRLHSIILASEEYLDEIWGEEKTYDGSSKSIPWLN